MARESNPPHRGITRRKALKTGVVLSSGLALGTTLTGTVGAASTATAEIVGEHHFVRAADDTEPSSIPDPQDRLVERRAGNPVDDGIDEGALDGTHQLRWGEFNAVNGHVTLDCSGEGTEVSLWAEGLVSDGLYTVWVVVFEEPGFHFDSREIFPFGAEGTAAEHVIAAGALGSTPGSENVITAHGSHGQLTANQPAGELSIFGSVGDCLLEEFEVHIIGDYHLDGQTHGPVPGGPGEHVEHFAAAFREGMPI